MLGLYKNKQSIFGYTFLVLLFITFPLREAFSINTGIQSFFRFGEALIFSSLLFSLLLRTNGTIKIGLHCLVFAIYSFFIGFLFAENVDPDYAYKFILRSFCCAIFIIICESKDIVITPLYLKKLFKYTVIINGILCIMQLMNYTVIGFNLTEYHQYILNFPRLTGTASEPGYLVPLLAPCYYYFLNKYSGNKKYFWATFLMLLFSTSSFGYAVIIIITFLMVLERRKSIFKYLIIYMIVGVIVCFVVITAIPEVSNFYDMISNKMLSFVISNEDEMDWSGAERFENRSVGLIALAKYNLQQLLFGSGLGAAKLFSEKFVISHYPSDECGIAYLGLLLNLGIVGVAYILYIIYRIVKCSSNDIFSRSLLVGFIIYAFQFLIVVNIWIYLFWFEAGLLILISRNKVRFVKNGESDII